MAKMDRPNFVIPEAGYAQLGYWVGKSSAKSFVYVIQAEGDTPIKVGYANHIPNRLAGLQTGNPRPLELLHVLVGGRPLERDLHDLLGFDERLMGEWFDGPRVPEFLEVVEMLAREMVLRHKNSKQLPSHRDFSPFRERYGPSTYVDWTDTLRSQRPDPAPVIAAWA